MGYNDTRDGTHVVDDVLTKYKEAWDQRGMVSSDGLLVDWFMVEQASTLPAKDITFTAWYVHPSSDPPLF